MAKVKYEKNLADVNIAKKCSIGIGSEVTSLMIKVYDEHLIRYYGSQLENDTVKAYVQHTFSLIQKKEVLKKEYDVASAVKGADLVSLKAKFELDLSSLEDEIKSVLEKKAKYTSDLCIEKEYYKKFFRNLEEIDDSEFEVYAILHDKDVEWQDFFTSKNDVQHIHIGIRSLKFKGKVKPRRKAYLVSDLLALLHVEFDPELDKSLLDNDAVNVVKFWSNYVYYLTHEDEASTVDGKYPYDRAEIHRNCSKARYEATIRGIDSLRKTKIDTVDLSYIRSDFVDMAAKGLPIDDIIDVLFPVEATKQYIKTNSNSMKALQTMYNEGASSWIASFPSLHCRNIFIQGAPSLGKSYALQHVIKDLGIPEEQVFIPRGRDTAVFLGLSITHKWGLFDDVDVNQIIKVGDDAPCFVRCLYGYTLCALENNIIVSNQPFEKYFAYYKDSQPDKYEAVLSRCAIAKFNEEDGSYKLIKPMTRGSRTDRIFEDKAWVLNFLDLMQKYTSEYASKDDYASVALYCRNREEADILLDYDNIQRNPFRTLEKSHLDEMFKNRDEYIKALHDEYDYKTLYFSHMALKLNTNLTYSRTIDCDEDDIPFLYY